MSPRHRATRRPLALSREEAPGIEKHQVTDRLHLDAGEAYSFILLLRNLNNSLSKAPLVSMVTYLKLNLLFSRFIPNRSTTDLEYSSFLLQRKERDSAKEEEEEEEGSPSKEEYRQAVLRAVTRGRPTQKGVLSFSTTTPSIGEGQ